MADLIPAPRPVPTHADRINDARTFRTWMSDTDRDQLDARAACAEQERDDALDDLRDARANLKHKNAVLLATARALDMLPGDRIDETPAVASRLRAERDEALQDRDDYREARDVLRAQLDTARADTHHDIARQLDILAADPGILRDWLTTCDPMPTSFGELFHALAEKLRRDDTPRLGSPSPRAQEPAREEIQWAYRWLDADGNVLDEMDTRSNVHETAEERARRLAANRPPSVPGGQVVRYRVVTTGEVVATYPAEREG